MTIQDFYAVAVIIAAARCVSAVAALIRGWIAK